MTEERASKRQQELLSFVDGFIKGNGYGPSYREIMRALGYKSVSTVAVHIDALIAKGYLARRDKSARSLEVVSLRSDNRVDTPTVTAPDIEQAIQARLATSALNSEQREQVVVALRLIGIVIHQKGTEAPDESTDQ